MASHYKAFIVVMAFTMMMFIVLRPLFLRFMDREAFALRRNVWLALTASTFLLPDFWLHILVAAPLLLFAAKRDRNPVALYCFLLLAVPPLRKLIPGFGIVNYVMPLDHLLLLSMCVLLPAALSDRASPQHLASTTARRSPGLDAADWFVIAFATLQVLLMMPYESMTASMRRVVMLGLSLLLPYFLIRRACTDRRVIVEAMASFALTLCVLAPVAVFEFFRGWMLYADVEGRWDTELMYVSLWRGDFLRAQVTAGHSITLGMLMGLGLAFWLYLSSKVDRRLWRLLPFGLLGFGLVAALARGPWVGAGVAVLAYLMLGPQTTGDKLKQLAVSGAAIAVLLVSPWGDTIIDHLPFVGTVDEGTVTYRQQLVAMAWRVIEMYPIFGSPHFSNYLEELRQGQGIIDLVNTFITMALTFGLVGLTLFLTPFVVNAVRAVFVLRRCARSDPDLSRLGACLVACLAGLFVVMATTSYGLSLPYVAWSLCALIGAYVRLAPVSAGAERSAWRPAPVAPRRG